MHLLIYTTLHWGEDLDTPRDTDILQKSWTLYAGNWIKEDEEASDWGLFIFFYPIASVQSPAFLQDGNWIKKMKRARKSQ